MEEIIKSEDKGTLANIKFKFPELMLSGAEEIVKKYYSHLITLQDQLQKARENVRSLEDEVKNAQAKWLELQSIMTYTHPVAEKLIRKETCGLTIQGHGNDIIGKTTVM